MFQKLLIANRGEIAVRVIRSAKKMGIRTVALYAPDDQDSQHVLLADEAFLLTGTHLHETYLHQELILDLALRAGADAIHPGYGFLSENAGFAARVEQAGLVFVGATPEQIGRMGEKTKAVAFVKNLGVPVIPAKHGTMEELLHGDGLPDFPVLVKASAGGGGKGMQIVQQPGDLPAALKKARRQAATYFGDETLFVEKQIPGARHIEIQIMGDGQGGAVHLFERECSIQRRYQKLIEEAPATSVSDALKDRLYDYALRIAKAVNYRGAGTVEFLTDPQGNCYFLEMNTRLQVEHAVTECITGLDLVAWQLLIAGGSELPLTQEEIRRHGHALEVRICAEDPEDGFKPSGGTIQAVHVPENVRWDSFITEKMVLPPAYDSLLGKVIVHDHSREQTIKKMVAGLAGLLIGGLKTNQLFLLQTIRSETFRTNQVTTCFLEEHWSQLLRLSARERTQIPAKMVLAAYLVHRYYRPSPQKGTWFHAGYWRIQTTLQVELDHRTYPVSVLKRNTKYGLKFGDHRSELSEVRVDGTKISFVLDDHFCEVMVFDDQEDTVVQYEAHAFRIKKDAPGRTTGKKQGDSRSGNYPSAIVSGLFGKVVEVLVEPGQHLQKGQNLVVIESMKMEFTIQCPAEATVKAVYVSKGKMVHDKEIVVDLEF